MTLTVRPRPHDLVRLTSAAAILASAPDSNTPAWARVSLARVPWAVVRHDRVVPGLIPVGVRGTTRDQRWAARIRECDISRIQTPESLRFTGVDAALWDVAAMRVLRALTASLDRSWAGWGPAGSVGFSLATGYLTVHPASDLDLLLRCPARPTSAQLDKLAQLFAGQEARVDCQIETPAGVAHLDELRRDGPSLVRTCAGPRLCVDPWEAAGT